MRVTQKDPRRLGAKDKARLSRPLWHWQEAPFEHRGFKWGDEKTSKETQGCSGKQNAEHTRGHVRKQVGRRGNSGSGGPKCRSATQSFRSIRERGSLAQQVSELLYISSSYVVELFQGSSRIMSDPLCRVTFSVTTSRDQDRDTHALFWALL